MWPGRRRQRPRPPRPPSLPTPPDHVDRFNVYAKNPFDDQEELREIRNEAAAALLDDDTYGYVMLRLKVEEASGEIVFAGHIPANYRSAFRRAAERVLDGLS